MSHCHKRLKMSPFLGLPHQRTCGLDTSKQADLASNDPYWALLPYLCWGREAQCLGGFSSFSNSVLMGYFNEPHFVQPGPREGMKKNTFFRSFPEKGGEGLAEPKISLSEKIWSSKLRGGGFRSEKKNSFIFMPPLRV